MAEDFICLGDPLEAFFGSAITRIHIRVKSPCEPSKGFLDVGNGRCPSNFKNDIEIVCAIHPNTA
jgi:hypothetical protein